MTRRRTCPKTRNNKKTARAKPLRMVRSSGEQLQGGKQRREEGAGRYRRAPSRRSLGKSSTKELLETVKAPEGRIAEQGQIMIILAARKDGHRTFHFWRFGKTRNVSFSIGRSERRSTKLTAGETAERQNCFSHLTAGKTAHHFFWQPERRQIKTFHRRPSRRGKTAALMASIAGIGAGLLLDRRNSSLNQGFPLPIFASWV